MEEWTEADDDEEDPSALVVVVKSITFIDEIIILGIRIITLTTNLVWKYGPKAMMSKKIHQYLLLDLLLYNKQIKDC